jgi:hypothetical protein
MKTANEDVYARIKSGSSLIAAGVRLGKPKMEAEGRARYAEAIIENAVRLYAADLTTEAVARISHLLFDLNDDSDEDATADAEETSQEIEALTADLRYAHTPASVLAANPDLDEDPDDEYEDDYDEDFE